MKKKLISIIALGAAALLSCCGSIKTASLGGGSYPGKDYVTSLRPSAASRQYFAQIGNKSPIESLTRANAGRSKSGVRFVANDGILIPAGVTIQFYNKGYCMDPQLPAPVSNEEYQLVPTSALIPSQLQGIYQNLVKRAAAGDTTVKSNMQGLVWALRTAGTEGSYAARLSSTQKRILDSCSSRPGEFERVHNSGLATGRLVGELWKLADSAVNVRFGNRTWKPSDFSSAGAFNSAINSQLDSLISMGSKLPIPRTGFNYGEPEPGIYTDINGAGLLAFNAKIANSTNKDFIFYPSNYVGQVGSGSVLSAVSFAASSSVTQRQRVTMGPIAQVNVLDKRIPDAPIPNDVIPFKGQSCAEKAKQIEMAALAAAVYGDSRFAETLAENKGYKLLHENIKYRIGNDYVSSLYINEQTKTACVVFRGTNNILDGVEDIGYFKSNYNLTQIVGNNIFKFIDDIPRFKHAQQFTELVIKSYPGYSINLVGHSLGGSVVQYVMSKFPSKNIEAYTFNSYGLPYAQGIKKDNRITDIINGNEFINMLNLLKTSRTTGKQVMVGAENGDSDDRLNIWDDKHSIISTLLNMTQDGCR
ncbi:MAG: DUF2974 domain-containing protein [Akkermansia sp.]|nr:DUF2974 domain-containing protein [Akkermansia sp.]